jgi:hypothetical protein
MEGYATDRANYEMDIRTQWDERWLPNTADYGCQEWVRS